MVFLAIVLLATVASHFVSTMGVADFLLLVLLWFAVQRNWKDSLDDD